LRNLEGIKEKREGMMGVIEEGNMKKKLE